EEDARHEPERDLAKGIADAEGVCFAEATENGRATTVVGHALRWCTFASCGGLIKRLVLVRPPHDLSVVTQRAIWKKKLGGTTKRENDQFSYCFGQSALYSWTIF